MGDDVVRPNLIAAINAAFSAGQIATTLQKLTPLSPRADVFAILQGLGLLGFIPGTVQQYRGSVGIPALNRRILTLAFRAALLNQPDPIPLHLDIVGQGREAVTVEVSANLISIVLIRRR